MAEARAYRSQLRAEQAAQTRRRVVAAAQELFADQGYHATTVAQIAASAGVSVPTVQKHGPKSALLQAALELASFGVEGETDLFATGVGTALLAANDPDELAAVVGAAMLEINEPSARLWMSFIGAAHGDEELHAYHLQFLAMIRAQIERLLRYIEDRRWLRPDVPFDDLVESFCIIVSVDAYVRFVILDRRAPESYRDFVTRTVRSSILAG